MRTLLVVLLSTLLAADICAQSDGFKREGTGKKRQAKDALEGKTAPSLQVKQWLNTKAKIDLASLKGKVVVLEWVNFGCPFVKKHYSGGNMQGLQKAAAEKGAVWITINSSAEGKGGYMPAEKMAAEVEKQGSAATHFCMDTDGKVGKAYGAKVTPHMYIIDASGKLAYNGAIDSKASTKAADIPGADPLFKNALDAVIGGKAVTPFLLRQLAEISGGRSLTANCALLIDNARVAAEIACAYHRSGTES